MTEQKTPARAYNEGRDRNTIEGRAIQDPVIQRQLRALDRIDSCNETANNRAMAALDTAMDGAITRAAAGMNVRISAAQNERIGDNLISMATEGRGGICPAPRGGSHR